MPKLQRVSQAERTEISDARMLDAAIKLIVERGAEKTTLKDVGELAGYSRGLAGYRFGSKAGLFEFVLRQVARQWMEILNDFVGDEVGYEAIEAAIDAHHKFCAEMPNHFMAYYLLWFETVGPQSDMKEVLDWIRSRRCEDIATWIRAGINNGSICTDVEPDGVATELFSALIGIVYQWLLNPHSMERTAPLYEGLKVSMKKKLSS